MLVGGGKYRWNVLISNPGMRLMLLWDLVYISGSGSLFFFLFPDGIRRHQSELTSGTWYSLIGWRADFEVFSSPRRSKYETSSEKLKKKRGGQLSYLPLFWSFLHSPIWMRLREIGAITHFILTRIVFHCRYIYTNGPEKKLRRSRFQVIVDPWLRWPFMKWCGHHLLSRIPPPTPNNNNRTADGGNKWLWKIL